MAKSRRGKRSKKNKTHNSPIDGLRTCISGENLEKTLSPLNLSNLFSPLVTPSPKVETPKNTSYLLHNNSFRARSKNSITKIQSIEKIKLPDSNIFETPRISLHYDDSMLYEYKTPLKRLRSSSFATNYNTAEKYLTSPEPDSKYYTPGKENIPASYYSTPKVKINNKFEENSLEDIQSLSPILFPESKVSQTCILRKTPPSIRYCGTFRRYRRYGMNWTCILSDFCNWLGVTFKKAIISLKRYYYDSLISTTEKSVETICTDCNCQAKITNLTEKVEALTAEITRITQTLEEFRKEISEHKISKSPRNTAVVAVPPPPPPPPPPMPIQPTPIYRPSKIAVRKLERQNSQQENSRPRITVDDLLKVQLRKTSTTTAIITRKPPQLNDDLFRQVKLRPPIRHNSPTTSQSPKSSLTRILKNVDTNVRRVRRCRLTPSLSYDESSRQRYFTGTRANDAVLHSESAQLEN